MANNFWKHLHPLLKRHRKPLEEEDTNYAILNAINSILDDAEEETLKAKIQSSLKTATDFYLDSYGDIFGVYRRRESETDKVYRERIVESLDIPRGSNQSIKAAVRRYLEDNTIGIEVYEPWTDIFYLNDPDSRLNGTHKIQGTYYHFAVIDVKIGSPFGRDIISLINDYKPAGVTLHTTYDSSIARIDITELEDWGAIPYTSLESDKFFTNVEMQTLNTRGISGNILMSQAKSLNDIFILNESLLNGTDVLAGSWDNYNHLLHLASTGSFNPTNDTLMKDVALNTEKLNDNFYTDRDKLDGNSFSVALRPTKDFYATINIDSLFGTRHKNIDRFKGEYAEALENAAIQLSFSAQRGNTVHLEAFNFSEGEWVILDKKLTQKRISMFRTNLKNAKEFINGNQIIFLRVTVPKDMDLSINHFYMSYNSSLREKDLGYGMEVLPGSSVGSNLVRNSTFKNGLKGFLTQNEDKIEIVGRGIILNGYSGTNYIQPEVELEPGTYTYQIWYEHLEGELPYIWDVDDDWEIEGDIFPFKEDDGIQKVTVTMTYKESVTSGFRWDKTSNPELDRLGKRLTADKALPSNSGFGWDKTSSPELTRLGSGILEESKVLPPRIRYATLAPANHTRGRTLIHKIKIEKGDKPTPFILSTEDND